MKTVGKQLQDARLAKDWSPELAARETKIKIERLRDLEADDFSNFSSPTYARGFVRTYARALGLDEYKLLRQLDNKLPEDDNASFANDTGVPYMPEPSKVSTPFRFSAGFFVAMGAGAVVLFLIAFVLVQSYRVGYFTRAIPIAAAPIATNSLPVIPDSDTAARALPADSNAAPVALPVDVGPATAADDGTNTAPVALPVNRATAPAMADTTTNSNGAPAVPTVPAAPVATTAQPAEATTPLDTRTPPRALPVDLSTLTATPVTQPAPSVAAAAPTSSTNSIPVASAPAAPAPTTASAPAAVTTPVVAAAPAPMAPTVSTPAPAPINKPAPSLSARAADARPIPTPAAATDSASAPVVGATPDPVTTPATPPVVATPVPVAPVAAAAAEPTPAAPAPATTLLAASVPATIPATADSAPALTGEAPVNSAPAPAASSAGTAGKRLVLKASRDSYIRVVSLDNPDGEQVRYSSVLHEGQSISFNDRKYSINIGVPSAVDILLDGINYGPHSDHSEPDTFTVESHQP